MTADKPETASIDQLSYGKLPKRVYDAIDGMELTVGEMLHWESTKQPTRILITKQSVSVDIHLRLPMKHLLLVLVGTGGIGGIIGWITGMFVA